MTTKVEDATIVSEETQNTIDKVDTITRKALMVSKVVVLLTITAVLVYGVFQYAFPPEPWWAF